MKAKLICNAAFQKSRIDKRIYGSFVEHMGRVVYSGIYEPDHALADEEGFRNDVLELTKQMQVTTVRYPGGNFVSAYDWRDGVGEKSKRPRKLELAWRSIETNQFGTNEFMSWAKKASVQPIFTVNLGTRGIENAVSLLEYCNIAGGTLYSDLRREHGVEDPYGISMWCLGNEMDGPWQIGHKSAEDYAKLAAQTGRAMKAVDPSIELIVCGSSKSDMKTFPDWDLTVLDHTFEIADYISVHQYYGGQEMGTGRFLAQSVDMEKYIQTIRAAILITQQRKQSNHQVKISVDEWGVWAKEAQTVDLEVAKNPWQIAPAISEQIYTTEDALLFASMLMVMVRNADIVKIGCQALLTNISACIMTDRDGGSWKQTIFYPFEQIATYGQGMLMESAVNVASYKDDRFGDIPYLDTVSVFNDEQNEVSVFAVNRCVDESIDLDIVLENFGDIAFTEHVLLYSQDCKATNFENHNAVIPIAAQLERSADAHVVAKLPPLSFNRITLKIS